MENIPAVITPLDEHMGLDIARSLGPRGVPVYGVDGYPDAVGRFSKYVRFVRSPNPERDEASYLQFLLDFGKELGKAVLFPLSDMHVLLVSRHRDLLSRYYEYVMPDHEIMERLTTKDGLRSAAADVNVPTPQTFPVNGTMSIEEVAAAVRYPAILKPTESTYWHKPEFTRLLRHGLLQGRAKVVLSHTPDELLASYQRIAARDNRLVVQEVIPGEDSRLAYIAFYLDRNSKPLGVFAGQKLRVIPTGFGSASYVRSFHDPDLEAAAMELLSASGYQGLGGLEFKKDPRDGTYKLIEFNTRFGMWDGLGARCGVDLAHIAYRDTLRQPVEPQLDYRDGVLWVDWQRDLRAAIEYRRKGELSLGQWLRSLRGEKMWAVYDKEDWAPGAAFTVALLGKMWERIKGATIRR
jgi:D-aspartate ligase